MPVVRHRLFIMLTFTVAGLGFWSGRCVGQPANSAIVAPPSLQCDDTIKAAFHPDPQTSVILVKRFERGAPLTLAGLGDANTPVAANDLCLVKLNVGPGHAGPRDAPSTSPGIGIEIWLPMAANWNRRIHVLGGGGWAGGSQGSVTALAGAINSAAKVAGVEAAVSATTDAGHGFIGAEDYGIGNGSFGMNPDGTINSVLWHDFSERAIHEMALKTKALTRLFYGQDARYSYWDGFSTGGRQGLKEAQANPQDFDGILAGAPAINWTRFIASELYPQIVIQRDLSGSLIRPQLLELVSLAAIRACDLVGGQHLGYITDPASCRYDPTTDPTVLCKTEGGVAEANACINRREAHALNKIWYGADV